MVAGNMSVTVSSNDSYRRLRANECAIAEVRNTSFLGEKLGAQSALAA
jgi:hypothetical protein